ncbi:MAG: bifunctional methylenetetrahydrofolate dehydrogenase/methenyltetrahydrofolate cyclohydrolase FolD [Micavibrio sp.]|nr:bifunctional methylenetetrahydrofolate dehydrogenase/methenyltetrahydrofolate cyclohydrolase FolD [Micavibrio sp.]|tara:strand:- start:209 stop:1051 length:843 start_codon:yes stop_codon:yes gene_type:complete
MSATIIDGRAIAKDLRAQIKDQVSTLPSQPGLAVILVGDDPASHVYVNNKIKATVNCGMRSIEKRLPADVSAEKIASVIHELNNDKDVHGILLQLPLPKHLDADPLIQMIAPEKDVDGLTFANIGKLVAGDKSGLVPCTPQGSLKLIKSVKDNLSGLHAVIIGRSLLFGKPMGQLLLQENCTVTQAHSRTKDLPALCAEADILIAAVGQPQMVTADWVKAGAIIIDVGINRIGEKTLVGDVDFDTAKEKVAAITPVPGGVGPMTIACLLANTLKAYENIH